LIKLIKDNQKLIGTILKWLIFVLSAWFIYRELFEKRDFITLISNYGQRSIDQWPFLLTVLLLMPINWLLEAIKWKRLLSGTYKMPTSRSLAATLSGVTVSILTPNRVGEFAGKMLFVPPQFRDKAVATSLIGSLAQLVVTLLIGSVCLVFAGNASLSIPVQLIIIAISLPLILWIYFGLGKRDNSSKFWMKYDSLKRISDSMQGLSSRTLREALLWSGLRYVVFSCQLAILLLTLSDFNESFVQWHLFYLVPLYFLWQTAVPTIALSEIGVRGMLLGLMFGAWAPESDLLLTSTLLWLINIIVPAIIGSLFLLRLKMRLFQ
jgi:hypothetical protein